MNRPRIAAVISGVVASTATFVVSSRYNLIGTVAGAVVAPVIYTLVSHGASVGVDAVGKRVRGRLGTQSAEAPDAAPTAGEGSERTPLVPTVYAVGDPTEETVLPASAAVARPAPGRSWTSSQWWLAGLACMAVLMSIYAVASSGGTTVVRQTVIKEVPVTTQAAKPDGSSKSGASATTLTTSAVETTTTEKTSATTDSTTTTTQPADTTTTSDAGSGGALSTDTTGASDTSAP